jgi:transposase
MKTNHPAIIGIDIDTHKATHIAVAIDTHGIRLAALTIPANQKGYLEVERGSQSLGKIQAFGIEGTGSYGAGLSRSLLEQCHNVIEVSALAFWRIVQRGTRQGKQGASAARTPLMIRAHNFSPRRP